MTTTKKVSSVISALITMFALHPVKTQAQLASGPTDKGFSFAVYGDSRSMMYLPYKEDQEAEARELMVEMFELVVLTSPSFCTSSSERVYITATDCESWSGRS